MTGGRQLSQFPAIAWLPGNGDAPDTKWLEAAKGSLADEALVVKGFELIRAGYFWEAHELLEKAWMPRAPNTPEREMLRAIIQIANGLLKVQLGKTRAVVRLMQDAGHILAALDAEQPVFGLTPAVLRQLLAEALAAGARSGCSELTSLQELPTCKKMQIKRHSL